MKTTLLLPFLALSLPAATFPLETADLSSMTTGWGTPRKNVSITGKAIRIGGAEFARGFGTHAPSSLFIQLDGKATAFTATVGVDDNATDPATASVEFLVIGDGRELWMSGPCQRGEAPRACRLDLTGVRLLELVVTDAGNGMDSDHANWAEPRITYEGDTPIAGPPPTPEESFTILTPPAPAEPRINGARITGLRPGSPFLFRIPCTGKRPITFAAEGLPDGITLESGTGILHGSTVAKGVHQIRLSATNARGSATRGLRLVVGPNLALTPPMGWNSWYIHYDRVNESHLRRAADLMVSSGMADHGYQYVNIDDCWMKEKGDEPYRDDRGDLLPNAKFPDIEGMTDHIHSRGLRAGTYISPGPWTCAGYVGSWRHEARDARWFARMGFDFLKYDWCSYGRVAKGEQPDPESVTRFWGGRDWNREQLMRPYRLMWEELCKQPRDIVHNLCQYGMGAVWEWGGEVGQSWRTTGDLGLQRTADLPGFYAIGMSNARHWEHARPGAWNDPDYLLIGWVGDAHGKGEGKATTLTPNEQYAYMSMWSLMAAPLFFSGDMEKLDAFTLNVLCNPEVIDINQDPLGKQARIVRQNRYDFILAKPLEGGSTAVGLFNLAPFPREIDVPLAELELGGPLLARDLWRHRDLGPVAGQLTATVPRHGVYFVRLKTR